MWEAWFAFHICIACLQPELLRRPVVERAVRALAVVFLTPAVEGSPQIVDCAEPVRWRFVSESSDSKRGIKGEVLGWFGWAMEGRLGLVVFR